VALYIRTASFKSARDLAVFCQAAGNSVLTIEKIVFDMASTMHVLYYTTPPNFSVPVTPSVAINSALV
jgi:hypothetical protein